MTVPTFTATATATATCMPLLSVSVSLDNLTSIVQVTGFGVPLATVNLYANGSLVGTTTIGLTGSFTILSSTLPYGINDLTATQTVALVVCLEVSVGSVNVLLVPVTTSTAGGPGSGTFVASTTGRGAGGGLTATDGATLSEFC